MYRGSSSDAVCWNALKYFTVLEIILMILTKPMRNYPQSFQLVRGILCNVCHEMGARYCSRVYFRHVTDPLSPLSITLQKLSHIKVPIPSFSKILKKAIWFKVLYVAASFLFINYCKISDIIKLTLKRSYTCCLEKTLWANITQNRFKVSYFGRIYINLYI